jgi:hypothetical protein
MLLNTTKFHHLRKKNPEQSVNLEIPPVRFRCTKFPSVYISLLSFKKINEEDQKAFDRFMNTIPDARKTVADVIMEKLTEKKTELQTQMSDESRTVAGGEFQLDDRIVQMYSNIKIVLQKYRSGKLPKAFKILPSLNNWEHVKHNFAEYFKDRRF